MKAGAIVFCIVLILLFVVGGTLSLPRGRVTDIGESGLAGIRDSKVGEQFLLRGSRYRVLNLFDERAVADRFTWKRSGLYYYNILVTAETGEQFVMAVRVTKEAQQLANLETPDLIGRISDIDEEQKPLQEIGLAGQMLHIRTEYCLNSEINSDRNLKMKAVFMYVMAGIFLFLAFVILKKPR